MSNVRKKKATLPGFRGPYFKGLEAVQHLYAGELQRINEVFLSDVRQSFSAPHDTQPAENVQRLITTEDGSRWMFNVGFWWYDREVFVLLPGILDSKKVHGTYAEQHVALYYKGDELNPVELQRIIRRATAAFEDMYDIRYGHIVN